MCRASGLDRSHPTTPITRRNHLEKVRCLSAYCGAIAYHARERCHAGDCRVLDAPCRRRRDLCAAGRHRGALAAFASRLQLEVTHRPTNPRRNYFMRNALVAVVLCAAMFMTACSAAWVSTVDSILAAAAPALVSILQIVAVANGQPMNSGLAAKITSDAAASKTLASDFSSASKLAAPGLCSQF